MTKIYLIMQVDTEIGSSYPIRAHKSATRAYAKCAEFNENCRTLEIKQRRFVKEIDLYEIE